MRPTIKFLSDELIRQIISEATDILCTLGVEIHNEKVLAMLSDCGCMVDAACLSRGPSVASHAATVEIATLSHLL